jgi:hypothetical protein
MQDTAKMDYDDEKEATNFVWCHFQHLMTEFERRVERARIGRLKAEHSSPNMARILNQRWGELGDADIEAALADGGESYRLQVYRRLLQQLGKELNVHRCPRCNRVVRTPKARQCLWCGFDWH